MAFVKFTLGDIRSAVFDKLDDDGFSTDTIDRAANDFQFELFNDNRIRFMEAHTVLAVSPGAYLKVLPTDFMTLVNLTVLDSATAFRDITKSGYVAYDNFMNRFANFVNAPASKIYNFTFFGESLRFQAPTDAAYDINLDYIRSPVLMTTAASECELPINYRELMTLGTLNRIQRVNEDYAEASQEFQYLQSLRTSFIKNYGRGGESVGPQVIGTNRRGRRQGYIQGEDM